MDEAVAGAVGAPAWEGCLGGAGGFCASRKLAENVTANSEAAAHIAVARMRWTFGNPSTVEIQRIVGESECCNT